MSEKQSAGRSEQANEASHQHATSIWEWLVAGAGALLIVALISYLGWQALTGTADVPDVRVQPIAIVPRSENFVVRVLITNASRATVAQLVVEGELQRNGDAFERSRTVLDYLPGASERRAGLIFRNDPRLYKLSVRAIGYVEP